MAWTIRDVGDEIPIGLDFLGLLQCQFFKQIADGVNHRDVLLFAVSANVVGFPEGSVFQDGQKGFDMIFHVEPVTDLIAFAVDGKGFAFQGIEDHQGDEFFRKLVRSVIVGTIGDQDRKPVGAVPGPYQMIRRRLGSRVGGTGRVWGGFREEAGGVVEIPVDLVGGNVEEPEGVLAIRCQGFEIFAGHFQEGAGAHHVGLDECRRAVDGAIHVAFGCQVHDCVRLLGGKDLTKGSRITDVDLLEGIVRMRVCSGDGLQIACVGEFVHVDDGVFVRREDVANECGSDEACAAGDEDFHFSSFVHRFSRVKGRVLHLQAKLLR